MSRVTVAYPISLDCADGAVRIMPEAAMRAARAALPSLADVPSVLASESLEAGWNATARMTDTPSVRARASGLDCATVREIIVGRVALEAVDVLRKLGTVTP